MHDTKPKENNESGQTKSTLDLLAAASEVGEERKQELLAAVTTTTPSADTATTNAVAGLTTTAEDGNGVAENGTSKNNDNNDVAPVVSSNEKKEDVEMKDAEPAAVEQPEQPEDAPKDADGDSEMKDAAVETTGDGGEPSEKPDDTVTSADAETKNETTGAVDTIAPPSASETTSTAPDAAALNGTEPERADDMKIDEGGSSSVPEKEETPKEDDNMETDKPAAVVVDETAKKEAAPESSGEKKAEANGSHSDAPAADSEKPTTEAATSTGPQQPDKPSDSTSEAPAPAAPEGASAPQKENASAPEPDKPLASETETTVSAPAEKEKDLAAAAPPAAEAANNPPPPVMKGTLSFDTETRRHLIRGMWNYENSNAFPAQRFELLRNLGPTDDLKLLPQDGEFHGSFSLAYVHVTSKGKRKERSKVIPESSVNIKFTKVDGKEGEYTVAGKGTNQFGVFHINGTATKSAHEGDPTLNVILRKRYEPSPQAVPAGAAAEPASSAPKRVSVVAAGGDSVDESGPLPPPSQTYPSGVVSLRGQMSKEESQDLGVSEVIHRVSGMWSSSLDFLLGDPQNTKGLCNRFEYEHKSSVPSNSFPVSGRYSGWFDLSNEDGSRTRINERDITLKFRKNNAGYHNVEGKGSNVFGKYNITGTLTKDKTLTIFRHFQPRKIKASTKASSQAASTASSGQQRRPSLAEPAVPKLKLDDVKIPGDEGKPLETFKPPANTTYSAVSRGVLRTNEDGSLSCQGKWAVTRDHFTNGAVSKFSFQLEPHFAKEALEASKNGDGEPRQFPLDSAMYKGSFQLKKQGSRYQTIVDQQMVMKFRSNTQGSFNVYGKGINAIGEFNLTGTLIITGKNAGQLELYRMYPPDRLVNPPQPKAPSTTTAPAPRPSLPPQQSMQRRESTRLVKLPSRLEDDDPSALLSRSMEKCSQILRLIREKDVELGGFFAEPVDPIALGIPTYLQIISEPMDLRTVYRRMEAGEVTSPEEFARLVRLVFENAMQFNIDPAHAVHQSARNLLIMFNQKFRDVERTIQSIRRAQGSEVDEKGRKKGKDDKKRKQEPPKSAKRRRLEEVQAMTAANAQAMQAIAAAAPAPGVASTTVTRSEFNLLLHHIQQLQQQITKTHRAVADLSPGDEHDAALASAPAQLASTTSHNIPSKHFAAPAPAPEKKKAPKRKIEAVEEPAMVLDDNTPLSLEEQENLTETINELPSEHLGGVIQIIRAAAPVGADEDEIDLEIDQLDTATQRKLLRYVQKHVKKSKAKKAKKAKTTTQPKKSKPATKAKPAPAKPAPAPPAAGDSFFAFGSKDDSDSDSDDYKLSSGPGGGKVFDPSKADNEFSLGAGLGDLEDDHDDELGSGGITANWNISKPASQSVAKDGADDDDAWGAAREEAAAVKARDAERKAREEKMKAEAELTKNQRLADIAKQAEELKAQRAEEKANETREKERQEKEAEEARNAAREAARAQVQSVEQTVDLDAQRDIMKQYEQSFLDKDLGGASPSSDFGF